MPRPDLDPELEQGYHEDLLATLRRCDAIEAEKAELRKAISGCLDEEWARVRVLRDLLEGRVSEQAALPGLEGPGERESRIGAVLRRAIEALESITGVPAEPEKKGKVRGAVGLAAALVTHEVARAAAVLGEARQAKGKASKKYPQGAKDLSEVCTVCRRTLGEHAGTKCPPAKGADRG